MRIRFEEFDDQKLDGMQLVRARLNRYGAQDHQRWTYLYRGRFGRRFYYKVWRPTYVRRQNMLTAIDAGFYDAELTPALKTILVDDSGMRGYVTAACKPRKNAQRFDTGFMDRLKAKTAETGFFNYDVCPHHVWRYRGRWSLIDLEGVYSLDQLDELATFHCRFSDSDYERFVYELRERRRNKSS